MVHESSGVSGMWMAKIGNYTGSSSVSHQLFVRIAHVSKIEEGIPSLCLLGWVLLLYLWVDSVIRARILWAGTSDSDSDSQLVLVSSLQHTFLYSKEE